MTAPIVPLRRPCPACAGSVGSLLFTQRFARIEGVSVVDGYEAVACASCGFCFAHDVPPQTEFDRYYAAASKYDNAGDIPEYDRLRFAAIARDIAAHSPDRHARILDLGCATGGLLVALAELGYDRLNGREPSPSAAASARERFGLDVRDGSLFGDDEPRAPFDVVVLVGVLEHLVDVPEALRRIAELLVPGGVAVIEVPDAKEFSRFPEAPFQQFSVEHVGYYSEASMANLLGAHGFEAVTVIQRNRAIVNGLDRVVCGFYRFTGQLRVPVPERTTANAITGYVELCSIDDELIDARLREIARDGRPIVVWGCGTLTLRLLATSPLRDVPIKAFIDRNPMYHGHRLAGATIYDPAAFESLDCPVLVCSFGSGSAIARTIREEFGQNREIWTIDGSCASTLTAAS